MKLPKLDNADRYQGLYVYDFGEWCAVGYTAEEVAVLLESPHYGDGKVYRLNRVWPDGRMELAGVSAEQFQLESGMFFYRRDEAAGRRDFAELKQAGEVAPPPCRVHVQFASRHDDQAAPFVTAMIYPAEYEEEVGRWLTRLAYAGGDIAEGGISHVSNYRDEIKTVLERVQLWPTNRHASRSPDEVLANVRRAVQR